MRRFEHIDDLGAAPRSRPEAAAAPTRVVRPNPSTDFEPPAELRPVRLEAMHTHPDSLEIIVEGRDPEAGRALVLWRLDSPRGGAVRLAHARSRSNGRVYFGPLLLPDTGALLVAAPHGLSMAELTATAAPAWRAPARAPRVPLLACEAGRALARAVAPGHRLLVADARGIPLDTHDSTFLSLDSHEPPVRVASLRSDGSRSSWLDLDPGRCDAHGGLR